ncbi:MAG: metalloregulator ArsR/SmtB family transcription factor [Lachnospiraceae bacterium]|nr:metalloregulator ArsR/SmtB family transcription factor [Lachnospiraceae bacterium]
MEQQPILLPHHHHENSEIIHHIPDPDNFQQAAEVLKLLGDGSRIRIFWILCHCEECVINIASLTGMSSPAASHHLKLLKANGLITSRRAGKEMYYTAADNSKARLLHQTIEQMLTITCPLDTDPMK